MMGIGPGSRCTSSPYSAPGSNPNPVRFQVKSELQFTTKSGQQVLMLTVNYPDAQNFEGDKIMVYLGFGSLQRLLKATGGKLDPHFADTLTAPVARFKPDRQGMTLAMSFIKGLP